MYVQNKESVDFPLKKNTKRSHNHKTHYNNHPLNLHKTFRTFRAKFNWKLFATLRSTDFLLSDRPTNRPTSSSLSFVSFRFFLHLTTLGSHTQSPPPPIVAAVPEESKQWLVESSNFSLLFNLPSACRALVGRCRQWTSGLRFGPAVNATGPFLQREELLQHILVRSTISVQFYWRRVQKEEQ